MSFVATLLLTVLFVAIALAGFYWLGVPSYRIDANNLVALIRRSLAGAATQSDWDVLEGFMIHHDPELEQWRRSLVEIAQREMIPASRPVRFSPAGERQLNDILRELDKAVLHRSEPDE